VEVAVGQAALLVSAKSSDMQENTVAKSAVSLDEFSLETFRPPGGAEVKVSTAKEGAAEQANLSSIVNVASHRFRFRENSDTSGQLLEQTMTVEVPKNA
jgi:hypothetical protein